VRNLAQTREAFARWLAGNPDDAVLRWLYRGLVVAAVAVLGLDMYQRADLPDAGFENSPGVEQPAATPLPDTRTAPDWRKMLPLRHADASLSAKMTFDLVDGGRLNAFGTIMPGTAKAFAAEVEKRGGYIKTVMLRSPGGSVQDALAMGRLIRKRNLATEVEARHYCASSCPLVFAGGIERRAGAKAAIGVHQVFAPQQPGLEQADQMADAQRISATVQGYLRDMGVDLGVWIDAMQTPKERLYYFTPKELVDLKLATQAAGASPTTASAGRKAGS
jgi:hypothetical protein